MALSEEQQEWLAAQAEDLAQRISGLARRHAELTDERRGLQLRLPVSRHASIDHRVRPPPDMLAAASGAVAEAPLYTQRCLQTRWTGSDGLWSDIACQPLTT